MDFSFSYTFSHYLYWLFSCTAGIGSSTESISRSPHQMASSTLQLSCRKYTHRRSSFLPRVSLSRSEQYRRRIQNPRWWGRIFEASEIYGQFNYHRDFIKDFAEIALPMINTHLLTLSRPSSTLPKNSNSSPRQVQSPSSAEPNWKSC